MGILVGSVTWYGKLVSREIGHQGFGGFLAGEGCRRCQERTVGFSARRAQCRCYESTVWVLGEHSMGARESHPLGAPEARSGELRGRWVSSTPNWKQAKTPSSSYTPQPASYAWHHQMEKDKYGPCPGLIEWNSVPGREKWVIRIILAIAGFVALSRL